jgi:hypothetical protein
MSEDSSVKLGLLSRHRHSVSPHAGRCVERSPIPIFIVFIVSQEEINAPAQGSLAEQARQAEHRSVIT